MLVSDFSKTCNEYDGFQVWEVENIEAFFKGNLVLGTIFQDFYKFPVSDLETRRAEIPHSDLDIMMNLLTLVNDKSFFVFTLHDENHLELITMQNMKIMNFGMDIEQLKNDRVYIIIMDKRGMTFGGTGGGSHVH
jgi:hypothetical protein